MEDLSAIIYNSNKLAANIADFAMKSIYYQRWW